jgi:FkbM family methyltransferase
MLVRFDLSRQAWERSAGLARHHARRAGRQWSAALELARAIATSNADARRRRLDAAVKSLSREVAHEIAGRAQAPAPMDYPHERILLRQSSPQAEKRLRSVKKEPWTVDWIERWFRAGDVFYDVGANVGAYSLIAAKAHNHAVHTFAFEPSAPSYNDLCLNVVLNGCADCITPLPFPVWRKTSRIAFGHFSLEPGSVKHAFDFETKRGNLELLFRQDLAALTLDDAVRLFDLPPPSHMKIDIEGDQLDILAGGRATLANPGWTSILAEIGRHQSAAPLEQVIRPYGFALVQALARKKQGGARWNLYARGPDTPRVPLRGGTAR